MHQWVIMLLSVYNVIEVYAECKLVLRYKVHSSFYAHCLKVSISVSKPKERQHFFLLSKILFTVILSYFVFQTSKSWRHQKCINEMSSNEKTQRVCVVGTSRLQAQILFLAHPACIQADFRKAVHQNTTCILSPNHTWLWSECPECTGPFACLGCSYCRQPIRRIILFYNIHSSNWDEKRPLFKMGEVLPHVS